MTSVLAYQWEYKTLTVSWPLPLKRFNHLLNLHTAFATMPTDRYFERYPPFPSDVSVVNLNCLSFTKLLANDALESRKLFQACQETGFFLINLKGSDEGETMLTHAETAFDLNERIHQVEKVELQKYAFKPPADLLG